jgi:hypothetical protein
MNCCEMKPTVKLRLSGEQIRTALVVSNSPARRIVHRNWTGGGSLWGRGWCSNHDSRSPGEHSDSPVLVGLFGDRSQVFNPSAVLIQHDNEPDSRWWRRLWGRLGIGIGYDPPRRNTRRQHEQVTEAFTHHTIPIAGSRSADPIKATRVPPACAQPTWRVSDTSAKHRRDDARRGTGRVCGRTGFRLWNGARATRGGR